MPLVIAFKFSQEELPKFYLPGLLAKEDLKVQDFCVAPREDCEDVGFVAALEYWSNHQVKPNRPIPSLIRRATQEEVDRWWEIKALERRALLTCKQKVLEHNLPMKVSTVRYETKNNKLAYLFTSDKRVDFRALVRDLAALLRCRIELWQIGVREEARAQDGYGVCGLRTCCSAWIKDFNPINLKMAKEQDIDLPPSKLTGQCGRLLCCLSYEVEAYRGLSREALPKGTTVVHARGRGVVVDRNLICRTYLVANEQATMTSVAARDIKEFSLPEQMKHMGRKFMAGLERAAAEGCESDEAEVAMDDEPEGLVATSRTDGVFTRIEDTQADVADPPFSREADRREHRDRREQRDRRDEESRRERRPDQRAESRDRDGRDGEARPESRRSGRGEHAGDRRGRPGRERRTAERPGREPRPESTEGLARREEPDAEGQDRNRPPRSRRRGRSGRRGGRPPQGEGAGPDTGATPPPSTP